VLKKREASYFGGRRGRLRYLEGNEGWSLKRKGGAIMKFPILNKRGNTIIMPKEKKKGKPHSFLSTERGENRNPTGEEKGRDPLIPYSGKLWNVKWDEKGTLH